MTKKKFTPREIKFSELGMKVQDILVAVLWGEIANKYMHKHSSWLFAKIEGRTFDGTPVDPMTDEELEQFRGALYDVSARIRRVADSL